MIYQLDRHMSDAIFRIIELYCMMLCKGDLKSSPGLGFSPYHKEGSISMASSSVLTPLHVSS